MSVQSNAINTTFHNNQDIIRRLASGSRINKASDDLAGFAIGQRQTSQINGLYQAARNIGDGISLVQTADAALGEGSEIFQRMRELAIQANNGIMNSSDREKIQKEIDQLAAEFSDIAENTQFNNETLFDGNYTANIQIGSDSSGGMKFHLGDLQSVLDNIDVTDPDNIDTAIQNIDNALETINDTRSELGASQNRLQSAMDVLQNESMAHSQSRSAIMDTDYAADISENERNQILSKVQVAMMNKENSRQTFLMELFK